MDKRFDDEQLVSEYVKCKRCRIVAEKFGCSDETVRRALIKYNVPRIQKNPRPKTKPKASKEELILIVEEYYSSDLNINDLAKKYKRSQYTISKAIATYGHGLKTYPSNVKKITDEQIIEESKKLTRAEIAEKYNMCICNVDRRLHRLNIKCVPEHRKHGTKRYRGGKYYQRIEAAGFHADFDASVTLKRVLRRDHGICQICGGAVDVCDKVGNRIGGRYPTIDHIIPISKGGAHIWENVQLAHMICNSHKNAAEVS